MLHCFATILYIYSLQDLFKSHIQVWDMPICNFVLHFQFRLALYEPRRERTGFCVCENKEADQLRGNREADQRLCFRYTDSRRDVPVGVPLDLSTPTGMSCIGTYGEN